MASSNYQTIWVNEFELDSATQADLAALLAVCFPDIDFDGRAFYKQLPHYRLLLRCPNGKLVGQLAIDYRIMNLNNEIWRVMGLIDLAVHPKYRGKGLAKKLLQSLESIAQAHKHNIDALYLVTTIPDLYKKFGFVATMHRVEWLMLENGINYGIAKDIIEDVFLMHKTLGDNKTWTSGNLDLLGYWY